MVSNDGFNAHFDVVTILPLTRRAGKRRQVYEFEVLLPPEIVRTGHESIVMPQQIRTISKVRLLERNVPAQEASWAGAGILPPWNRRAAADPYEQLAGWSCELHAAWHEQLREETGIDNGYRRCGGIYLATSAADWNPRAKDGSTRYVSMVSSPRPSPAPWTGNQPSQ